MNNQAKALQEKVVSAPTVPAEFEIHPEEVSQFSDSVKKLSNVDINACYQCRKCTSGCPVAYAMDYTPAQILQAARLGLKDLVLGSATIWLCAACETCVARCPQDVNLVNAMDAMRAIALSEGYKPKEAEVADFYRYSLGNIELFGRMYEMGLMGRLKLATRKFRKDMSLGLGLFKRGKLSLIPDLGALGVTLRIRSRVRKSEKK
ncbi:MAG: 4Fe-4S dicluster domain-containing protein [Dehalococcoidales bacterium]|jgi:heterodisulfide reductase subunit C